MNRSWTIAAASAAAGSAAVCLGLFLAVAEDSLAEDTNRNVKVITVTADEAGAEAALEEAQAAAMDADAELHGTKGGYLGLSLREDTNSNEGGAYVERVVHDSPAAKAGLKSGDVIVGFGGEVVRGPAKVTEKIRAAKPGDKVSLDVRREGTLQKFSVELGQRSIAAWTIRSGEMAPFEENHERALKESLRELDDKKADISKLRGMMKLYSPGRHGVMVFGRNRPLLGIEMVETTPELREVLGGSKEAGVLVGKVLSGSAAEKGALKVGDLILSINGEKVSSAGELGDVIGKHQGTAIDLDIVREKRSMRVKAVLPKIDEPDDDPTGPRARHWRIPAFAALSV